MSSNETRKVRSVGTNEVLILQGSNCEIIVAGDVYSGAKVVAQGSNATIKIGGYIWGAEVIAQGSNAMIEHHGKQGNARVIAQGSNSEIVDLSIPDGYDFATDTVVPTRKGKKGGVRLDGVKAGSISISDVVVDGERVDDWAANYPDIPVQKIEDWVANYPDIPVQVTKTGDMKVLDVIKSPRPRDKWGTPA